VLDDYEIGTIEPDEKRAFFEAASEAFQDELNDDDVALRERQIEPERTLVARSGGAIVANSALITMRLAIPGGAVVPMAGVTAVGVDPVHRRRGLLDRLMRGHLTAIHERGDEVLSALWASEAGIYGRWGFGPAARLADLTVRSPEARLLAGPPADRPRAGAPADLLPDMRAIYDAVLPHRPGLLARDDLGWEDRVHDPEHRRGGAGRLRGLLTDGGYALYAVREQDTDGRPDGIVELRELIAATPTASAVLWHHLLSLSLTRTVRWESAPEDEPLAHMIDDARAVSSRVGDGLYVRLVDLPRALTLRTYDAPVEVVMEVADPVCPWNAGRWRLAAGPDGATCEPADAAPDLAMSATELGAAYLGGVPLALLAAAGRVEERTPGAVAAASRAFRGVCEPWCAETF
jgi:predicted acetyltransferase